MTVPVGDERTPRRHQSGEDPITDLHPADAAEDAARWSVEGRGIPDRDT